MISAYKIRDLLSCSYQDNNAALVEMLNISAIGPCRKDFCQRILLVALITFLLMLDIANLIEFLGSLLNFEYDLDSGADRNVCLAGPGRYSTY